MQNASFVSGSAILWEGPSALDGAPIVVIATGLAGASRNTKTGDMVQTWILRQDIAPYAAVKGGQDSSVCGDCPHRPINGGACYVNTVNAPGAIWRAYRAGRYVKAADLEAIRAIGAGRAFRLGAYGDPAAAPLAIWQALTSQAKASNGYPHQWRRPDAQGLASLCMASADSVEEREEARAMGWRTFRVRAPFEPVVAREFICPASEEAGKKTDCATCRACGGTEAKAKASPVIIAHGATARRFILTRNAHA